MEVDRQRCHTCGSLNLHEIVVRQQGEPSTVYVSCADCGDLVARYRLRSYYHHGKGAESFYRSVGAEQCDSGRASLDRFRRAKEEAFAGYEAALKELKEENEQE